MITIWSYRRLQAYIYVLYQNGWIWMIKHIIALLCVLVLCYADFLV